MHISIMKTIVVAESILLVLVLFIGVVDCCIIVVSVRVYLLWC